MAKNAQVSPLTFLRTGPTQYVDRAGILNEAGECIAFWGSRALISGGKRALAATEERLTQSLSATGIHWQKHLFTGESSPGNISTIKEKAQAFDANVIVGVGGGKSLDAAKDAAAQLSLPAVCVPTIAATASATTALSVIYNDAGEFQGNSVHARNPSLVLVDPEIITHSPGIYLRAGILDSLAKWYEGRSVRMSIENPNVQTLAAYQLSEVLYKGHRRHAINAVRLNSEHRVGDDLIQTLDLVIFLTGVIQTLAKGTLFNAVAHPLHNGMTLMKESHHILHGLKVGYGIMVQLCVEKCSEEEFEDVLSFFRQLGLEPSLKGLNLPYDREVILRVADKAVSDPGLGKLTYPLDKFIIASAIEQLEKRLA
jgi:glycerol dehydrogenase